MKEQLTGLSGGELAFPTGLWISWGQGWGLSWSLVCVQHHPTQSQAWRGLGGPTGGQLYVCKIFLWADLWEPVLSFLFRRGRNGGHLWDFHKHLRGFLPGERENPTYFGVGDVWHYLLSHWPPFCSLNCQAHSSLWTFPLAIPTLWELCSHSSWNSSHTLASAQGRS